MQPEGGGDNLINMQVSRESVINSETKNFRRPDNIKGIRVYSFVKIYCDRFSIVEGYAAVSCKSDQIAEGALKWLAVGLKLFMDVTEVES